MKSKKLLMFCLTSLAELSQHTLRQEIKLGEILMKNTEVKGAVDQVLAKLAEAITKTRALADIVPNVEVPAEPQPEPAPAEEVPAEEVPAEEVPAEEVPAEPVVEVPAEIPTEGTFE